MRKDNGDWVDINPCWDGNRVVGAPYNLIKDGDKITVTDKTTGNVSVIEILSVSPSGIKSEIVLENTRIHFRHTLPSDKIPFEAQFKVTGEIPLSTRAFDDEGELELKTSLVDGILVEKLSQVRDKETKELRTAKGNIRIDPTLTVQPSGKDTKFYEDAPDTNYGSDVALNTGTAGGATYRNHVVLEFDISGLPSDAILDAATLYLYYYDWAFNNPNGRTIWAYKLTRTDWVEAEATWNSYKTGSNWTTSGGDYVTSNPSGGSTTVPANFSWMTWGVLAIVQDAYDSSIAAEFLIKDGSEEDSTRYIPRWYSNDYTDDTSLRPKLIIEYTEVQEISAPALAMSQTTVAPTLAGSDVATTQAPVTSQSFSTVLAGLSGSGVAEISAPATAQAFIVIAGGVGAGVLEITAPVLSQGMAVVQPYLSHQLTSILDRITDLEAQVGKKGFTL